MNWNEWTIVFAWRVSDRPSVLFDCLLFHEGPFNLSQSTVKYRHSKIVLIWNKWSSGSAQKRPVSKTGYSLCHFVNLPVLKPRVAEKLVKMAEDIFIFFEFLESYETSGRFFLFILFFQVVNEPRVDVWTNAQTKYEGLFFVLITSIDYWQ